jgi:glycosyltransferase involved in cell wall biosynthesis
LTQYFSPEIGAPQNRLYELATGLKKRGWEVAVVTAMPNYPKGKIFDAYRGRFKCNEEKDGLKIRRYWLYPSNSRKTIPRILSMLSFSFTSLFSWHLIRKGKYNYIMVESPPLTLGLTGMILSKISGAKLIFNVSDLWPLSARELGYLSDGFIYRQLEKTERFIYKKASLCTGQSQEIVDYVSSHGARRTFLFRNGVDPERFSTVPGADKGNTITLVYTGLIGIAQGIPEICKNINFKSLGTEFHIYGDGSEKEKLISYLKSNPDRGIYYEGTVSRDQIPDVLAGYTLTLIALTEDIYGAVPSKIYESMAAGLPIIFSGGGEGKKIIEEYNLGWTTPAGDYQALEEVISKVITQKSELEKKRVNCLEAASKTFNRQKQIDALSDYLAGEQDQLSGKSY